MKLQLVILAVILMAVSIFAAANILNENGYGNSASNLLNGGEIFVDSGYVYYNDKGDFVKINMQTKEVKVLLNGQCSSVNIIDNTIYFLKGVLSYPMLGSPLPLCKMNTDGSGFEVLDDTGSNFAAVIDDYIYYTGDAIDKTSIYYISGTIYKMNRHDKTKEILVASNGVSSINVTKNNIYYVKSSDNYNPEFRGGGNLCKISLDGGNEIILTQNVKSAIVDAENDLIYYDIDVYKEGMLDTTRSFWSPMFGRTTIHKMDINGENIDTVYEENKSFLPGALLNLSDGYLYFYRYRDYNYGVDLCRIKPGEENYETMLNANDLWLDLGASGEERVRIMFKWSSQNNISIFDNNLYFTANKSVRTGFTEKFSYDLNGNNKQPYADPNIYDKTIIDNETYYTRFDKNDDGTYTKFWYKTDINGKNIKLRKDFGEDDFEGTTRINGNEIYFRRHEKGNPDYIFELCKTAINGTEITVLDTGYITSIELITDEYVIYKKSAPEQGYTILGSHYIIKKDGTDKRKLLDRDEFSYVFIEYLKVINNKIFFRTDKDKIYKMNLDGTNISLVKEMDRSGSFYINFDSNFFDDKFIYYATDQKKLYKFDPAAGITEVLLDYSAIGSVGNWPRIMIKDGWAYFIVNNSKVSYKIRLDGKDFVDMSDSELCHDNGNYLRFEFIDDRIVAYPYYGSKSALEYENRSLLIKYDLSDLIFTKLK